MKYMNSKDVALIMGVNVSTIKRWTDAHQLPCYQTPGGHRKFTLGHINEFLKKNKKKIKKVNLLELKGLTDKELIHNVEHGDFSKLNSIFFKAAIEADQNKISTIITGLYLKGVELENIYDNLVFPVMHSIGELWEKGKLTIPEEHLASEVVRKAIYELGESLNIDISDDGPSAICFGLAGDEHELPLIMAKQILELNGIRAYNLGRSTPVISIVNLLKKVQADFLIISANYQKSTNLVIEELTELIGLIRHKKIKLLIGGNASILAKQKFGNMIGVIDNMKDLKQNILFN